MSEEKVQYRAGKMDIWPSGNGSVTFIYSDTIEIAINHLDNENEVAISVGEKEPKGKKLRHRFLIYVPREKIDYVINELQTVKKVMEKRGTIADEVLDEIKKSNQEVKA